MNKKHLETIFKNYIDNFEQITGHPHNECYKWQIAKQFRPMMDGALAASTVDFADKLSAIQKLTGNLTDSGHALPFTGLVKAAEKDPGAVQEMFRALYADSMNDPEERQARVEAFLKKSQEIIEKADLGGHLYQNNPRSVSVYLFLYDPDNNYIFKPYDSREFADCVEYYDDWGQGADVKFDVYYRMCDQLVEAIKADAALMETDASRFSDGWGVDPASLHPDPEKHILAFDLIHACAHYGLYSGVNFDKTTSKERQLRIERKKKAEELAEKLDQKRVQKGQYDEAIRYLNQVYTAGTTITHKKFGAGTIIGTSGSIIEVEFLGEGIKKLGLAGSVSNGIISVDVENYTDKVTEYRTILLKSEKTLSDAVENAEKELDPYLEYLE